MSSYPIGEIGDAPDISVRYHTEAAGEGSIVIRLVHDYLALAARRLR
jgi:hypothetical protein